MIMRASRPSRRNGSTFGQFRRRTPADVLAKARGRPISLVLPATGHHPEVRIAATIGAEITFSLRSRDVAVVKARQSIAAAHVEQLFDAIRQDGAVRLTHRQCVSLSGEIYRSFIAKYADDPLPDEVWSAIKGLNRAAREGRDLAWIDALRLETRDEIMTVVAALGPDMTTFINAVPADDSRRSTLLEKRFGALTDRVLAEKCLVIDEDSRAKLLPEIDRAATDALWRLKANVAGNYAIDATVGRFPEWTGDEPGRPDGAPCTWDALIARWEQGHIAINGSPLTRREWRSMTTKFAAFSGKQDPTTVTPDDVDRWKDKLLADKLSAVTVADKYLACLRIVYKAGMRGPRALVRSNPAAEVRVLGSQKAAKKMGAFSNEIAGAILAAARREADPTRRWVPWLTAFTGARLDEIFQLRACDVIRIDNVWCLDINLDAGRKKTRQSVRVVPIHPAIVSDGFLRFVADKRQSGADTKLFYTPGRSDTARPGKSAYNRLMKWQHSLGLAIGAKHGMEPNHGWRHWIKRTAADVGIQDRVIDAIVGHAPATVGSRYGGVSIAAMARDIAKIPVPIIDGGPRSSASEN